MTTTMTCPQTRWIDSVARHYGEDSPTTVALANLHAALQEADALAEELARYECDGECGARGYGNDPERIACSCELGLHDGRAAIRIADSIMGWASRIHAFSLHGMDMALYTRALRVWDLLQGIRPGERLEDVVGLAREIREALA